MNPRAQGRTRRLHRSRKAHLAVADDGERFAQPFGMGHDMGGKQDGGAALAFCPDEFLKALLVERIEAREWLVQHDQLWLVDEGAEKLHRLRHALGQRSEEHTSELQSLMRISYAVF